MPAVTVVPRVPLGVSRRLRGPFRNAEWSGAVTACAVAARLALLVGVMGWRGSDLPAQLFRVELFRRDGFVLWNSQWFAGHPTLDYSVLSPVLGALTGPIALGAACGIASGVLVPSPRLSRVWPNGIGRIDLVRDEHGDESPRRPRDLRARADVRARRALRPPTPTGLDRGCLRIALRACEPGRRRVPRSRGRCVGLRPVNATDGRMGDRRDRHPPGLRTRTRVSEPGDPAL